MYNSYKANRDFEEVGSREARPTESRMPRGSTGSAPLRWSVSCNVESSLSVMGIARRFPGAWLLLSLAACFVRPSVGFVPGLAGAGRTTAPAPALGRMMPHRTCEWSRVRAPCAALLAKKKKTKGDQVDGSARGIAGEQKLRKRTEEALRNVEECLAGLGGDVGFGLDADTLDRVDELLTQLELCNAVDAPARSAKLWGTWELVFTNSPPMLKNRGLTGLGQSQHLVPNQNLSVSAVLNGRGGRRAAGALPFVSFRALTQRLESSGEAESIETLSVPPFGSEVTSSLRGRVTSLSEQVCLPPMLLRPTRLQPCPATALDHSALSPCSPVGTAR